VHLTAHRFQAHDLIAGHASLDWVNTVTARDSEPHDWVVDFAALLQWARLTRAFAQKDLAVLDRQAKEDPSGARKALGRCKQLRETLHRVFGALIDARSPAADDLAALDKFRIAAHARAQSRAAAGRVLLRPSADSSGMHLITDVLILNAVPPLLDPPGGRLRVCAGCDCGWLFHDTSKGGQRRWCDMSVCGAVEKARRFRGSKHARA
jgi:predicted RNA-binding Zn ribbon-like protein